MLDIEPTLSFERFELCSSPCPAFFVVGLTKWMNGLDVLIENSFLMKAAVPRATLVKPS
jgi:hypothetical protein